MLLKRLKKSTALISLLKDNTRKLEPPNLPTKNDPECANLSKPEERETEVVSSDCNLVTVNSAVDNVPNKPICSKRHIRSSSVVGHREPLVTGLPSLLQVNSKEFSQSSCQQDGLSGKEAAESKTEGTSLGKFIETTISQLEGKSVQQLYETYFSSVVSSSAGIDVGQLRTEGQAKWHSRSTKPSTYESSSCVTHKTDNIPHAAKLSASSVQCFGDSMNSAVDVDALVDAVLRNFEIMSLEDLFKYYFDGPIVEIPPELRAHICEESANPGQSNLVGTCEIVCTDKSVEETAMAREHSCSLVEEMTEALRLPREKARHLEPSIDKGCVQPQNEFSVSGYAPSIGISQDVPGTWVECVLCNKWRFLDEVTDPSVLDDAWHCGLQRRYNEGMESARNPCDEPQAELDDDEVENRKYVLTKFTAGSLIWAKLDGYPEWPAMVDCDATGRYAEYDQSTGEAFRYFVVFFDPKRVTRQCIRVTRIRRFTSAGDTDLNGVPNKYRKRFELAVAEAEKALGLSLQDRIFTYGYPYPEESSPSVIKRKKNSGSKVIPADNGALKVVPEADAMTTKVTITSGRPEDMPNLDVDVPVASRKTTGERLLVNMEPRIKRFNKTGIRKNFKPPRMNAVKTKPEENVPSERCVSGCSVSKPIMQTMHMSPTSMKPGNVGEQLKPTVQFVSAQLLSGKQNDAALDNRISLPSDATSFGNFEDTAIAQQRWSRDDHSLPLLNLIDDLRDQRLVLHSPQQAFEPVSSPVAFEQYAGGSETAKLSLDSKDTYATSGLQFDLLVDEVLRKIEKLTTKELAWRYFPELQYWLQVNAGPPQIPSHFKNNKPTNEFREAPRVLKQLAHEMKRRRTMGNHSAAHFSGPSNISSSCDSPNLPGTWVECSLCKKWRYLPHVHDPSQIVVDWHCGFSQDATGTTGVERVSLIQTACDRPQSPLPDVQEDDCIFTEFAVGSIVWAKLQGYPEWPAMVYYNEDGRYAEYDVNTRDVVHYHVVFLDPTRSTISRVRATKLRRFTPPAEGYMDKVVRVHATILCGTDEITTFSL
ncbi:hypothetical protein P879_01459 [Paragonimus westermani]|uniref:Zinc finger CW-type PWWP domain protein 1 n=1 Tax=Paragonimus westermani TaxID=34504 RepID=A0A8T0DN48_9TREM|nr:hypothetical protein P879_01459 [Paragonimus westermani]